MTYPYDSEWFGSMGSLGAQLLGNNLGYTPANLSGLMNFRPRAYRAPDLGPNQIAWLRKMRWIDNRTVVRKEAHNG